MKGVNWGRIVARVLSIVLVLNALESLRPLFELFQINSEGSAADWEIGGFYLVEPSVQIALAVILWFGAARFAPQSVDAQEDPKRAKAVVTIVIAAVGAYFFFWQGFSVSGQILRVVSESADLQGHAGRPMFLVPLGGMILAALIVFRSKPIATWIMR